jgi:histidinol-phosphate aminotransferase
MTNFKYYGRIFPESKKFMNKNISRREWLIGGTVIAGSMLTSNIGLAQSWPEINKNPTPENPIRCAFNENVYGPSLKAKEAILGAYKEAHLYNFATQFELKKIISTMENLPQDHIAMESGSTPFLDKAAYVAKMHNGAILVPYPTYNSVIGTGQDIGAKIISVPVGDDMAINLDAMRAAMTDEVKLVYLCNPNNPIPTIIEKNALRDFCLEMSKKALVLVDEAYYEYADSPDYATMADLVQENKNIIVARTASKIHAFAGIRVGFAFAHPETLKLITGRFNLSMNYMALKGAIASYQDTEYQTFIKQKNKESMQILYNMFEDLKLEYIKSNSNFTFFNARRPSSEVEKRMKELGVLTGREFKPFTNWVRISTAKPEEMRYVTDIYRKEFG